MLFKIFDYVNLKILDVRKFYYVEKIWLKNENI